MLVSKELERAGGDAVNAWLRDRSYNCIRTYTGAYVNLGDPDPDTILIEDIAHALAHMPRYAGHTEKMYTVAQHSLYVSSMLPAKHRLAGLLHDASEAYLMDMPAPIKHLIPGYKVLEHNLMQVIADRFHFDYPLHPLVIAADRAMFNIEWEHIVADTLERSPLDPLPHNVLKRKFLDTFDELTSSHI